MDLIKAPKSRNNLESLDSRVPVSKIFEQKFSKLNSAHKNTSSNNGSSKLHNNSNQSSHL